jgi:hypothetical protein
VVFENVPGFCFLVTEETPKTTRPLTKEEIETPSDALG